MRPRRFSGQLSVAKKLHLTLRQSTTAVPVMDVDAILEALVPAAHHGIMAVSIIGKGMPRVRMEGLGCSAFTHQDP